MEKIDAVRLQKSWKAFQNYDLSAKQWKISRPSKMDRKLQKIVECNEIPSCQSESKSCIWYMEKNYTSLLVALIESKLCSAENSHEYLKGVLTNILS